MLEFVQTTIANMTALVIVCKKIPSDKDSREIRERIAEAMIAYARSGKRTLSDLENHRVRNPWRSHGGWWAAGPKARSLVAFLLF